MNKIEQIISKMSVKEKIGQLSQNLFGWKIYAKNGKEYTDVFHNELNKYSTIGLIYGILRSDPWSQVNYDTGVKLEDRKALLEDVSERVKGKHGIRPFLVEETPHGHQSLDATTIPVNLAVGCSFNKKLYQDTCSLLAKEIRMQGANIGLLSCLDMALDPRWGRAEECYGEDTYLAMEMAHSAVVGYQGEGDKIDEEHIGIVVKHFIGQGSSNGGHNGKTVSMGENELVSHHLPIMQKAIDANVIGCMAAYNDIDAIPCHANESLLKDKLRGQMGFNGFVMSDGCAIDNLNDFLPSSEHSIAKAISAGVDTDLWNVTFNSLESAFEKGIIKEEELNYAVRNVLNAKERLGLLSETTKADVKVDYDQLDKNNLKIAEESIVMLENDGTLPLSSLDDACLIGPYADNIYHQLGDYSAFQNLDKIKSIKEVFNIPHAKGCMPRSESDLLTEAVELAKKHKYVILNIGSSSARDFDTKFDSNGAAIVQEGKVSLMDCGEGMDVAEVRISDEQQKMFDAIYAVNKNIITLITSGRPIGIEKIAKKSLAVIQSFYGGQRNALAIKNVLLGKANPSGRLAISVPYCSAQLPVYYWRKETYKYIDMSDQPLYPFGHGLSYSNINIKQLDVKEIKDNEYEVTISVSNDSKVDAMWPVLVFATLKDCEIKPPSSQLVAFDKVEIKANEKIEIKLPVNVSWLHKNYKFKRIEFNTK